MARFGRLGVPAAALAATLAGLLLPVPTDSAGANPAPPAAAADPRPSIVLVLMDDFSMDLLPTMRHAMEMRRSGAFYRHSYVVNTLCCPSRASLLTGQYPHQTGVRFNVNATSPENEPLGGFAAFKAHGNLERSVNVQLQAAGYTTGLVGKYLNLYRGQTLPPGWSTWRAIGAGGYGGWGYRSTYVRKGVVHTRQHPAPPASASEARKDRAYVGQVTQRMALGFIHSHRDDRAPYFLEVAPYATHSRDGLSVYRNDPLFPPAFRDRGDAQCGPRSCHELDVRDLPGFADPQADNAPRYASGAPARQWRKTSGGPGASALTRNLRDRARMAQSIDRMLARILASVDRNTYVLLTSDNGYHLGQHRLGRGKGTPFTSDVQVPLLVVGPGVKPGGRGEVVSNIDLAPTFEDLAGLTPAPYRSGRSLVPTFGRPNLNRRTATFIEHTKVPKGETNDPDAGHDKAFAHIPSYAAVRTPSALLVRFDLDPTSVGVRYAWEFYDYSRVGWEKTNTYGRPGNAAQIRRLTRKLEQFDACATFVRDDTVPRKCRNLTQ